MTRPRENSVLAGLLCVLCSCAWLLSPSYRSRPAEGSHSQTQLLGRTRFFHIKLLGCWNTHGPIVVRHYWDIAGSETEKATAARGGGGGKGGGSSLCSLFIFFVPQRRRFFPCRRLEGWVGQAAEV